MVEKINNHEEIQKNVKKINEVQKEYGGLLPEYINMYFAAKLEKLTVWLIILTCVLSILTAIQIIILILGV